MKEGLCKAVWALLAGVILAATAANAVAQIQVTSANPNNAAQGTVNLNVIVNGNGFKKGAKAQWFVSGTTNPGGVTVNSTTFNGSGQVTANITVAVDAYVGGFDIIVTNTDGRSGKGTELFAVNSGGTKASCAVPVPINPVVNLCTSSTAQTGCIDSNFGANGAGLLLDMTLGVQGVVRLQPQPDGTEKIVVGNQTASSAMVARFNLDGSLDSSFGSGGISSYKLSTSSGMNINDMAIDVNGNILAVGSSPLFVMRFLPNGGLDSSFASNGVFTYQPSGSGWYANGWALTLQPDGKIVVAGSQSGPKPPTYSLVVRLTSNGTLDSSFGSGGISSFIPAGSKDGGLKAVALQSLGSSTFIIGAGSVDGGGWLGRLTSSGAIDLSFGSSGQVAGSTCGGVANARSVYVDGSGSIFMLGYSNAGITNGPWEINLAKYTASGAIDTTFGDVLGSGHTGNTFLNVFGGVNVPGYSSSLIATTDSTGTTKLLVTGYGQTTGTGSTAYSVLARYNLNGTLDSTFGGGVVARGFGPGAAWGMGAVSDPNGGIIPFIVWDNSGGYLALTRYWP